ncbi:MAG TPA: carbohydrate kinase family protein, partial [Vicinamibacterales bacterium]|nr:carbohydrate kinase family protein [Vicinamibacterales bacterium]
MRLPLLRPATDVTADIVVAGENSVDVLGVVAATADADADKRTLVSLQTLVGGQAATAAVGCARLGVRARYVGVVGDDDRGALVGEALAHERVDAHLAAVPGVPTRAAMILVDEATGRRTVYERRHPSLRLDAAAIGADVWTDARILLVDATDPV